MVKINKHLVANTKDLINKIFLLLFGKRRFFIHIGFKRNTLIGSVQTPDIIFCS